MCLVFVCKIAVKLFKLLLYFPNSFLISGWTLQNAERLWWFDLPTVAVAIIITFDPERDPIEICIEFFWVESVEVQKTKNEKRNPEPTTMTIGEKVSPKKQVVCQIKFSHIANIIIIIIIKKYLQHRYHRRLDYHLNGASENGIKIPTALFSSFVFRLSVCLEVGRSILIIRFWSFAFDSFRFVSRSFSSFDFGFNLIGVLVVAQQKKNLYYAKKQHYLYLFYLVVFWSRKLIIIIIINCHLISLLFGLFSLGKQKSPW